jgi:RES domain-containing protein
MKVRANRAFGEFRRRLTERPELLRPWRGFAYRVTTLDYPRPRDILMGQGSFLHGGRWNAPGSFRAVYGSTTDLVAVQESRANAEYAGIALPFRRPRLLVVVELALRSVLDLTTSEALELIRLTADELRAEDWRKVQAEGFESFTQSLGRAVFESGANGLLAPSARVADGVTVVYVPENRTTDDEASVCESEQLDRIHVKY